MNGSIGGRFYCAPLSSILVYYIQGGATACEGFAQYGMPPADSAKTEVTMRPLVENCSNKVMVSESQNLRLDFLKLLLLLLLYSQIYLSSHMR